MKTNLMKKQGRTLKSSDHYSAVGATALDFKYSSAKIIILVSKLGTVYGR